MMKILVISNDHQMINLIQNEIAWQGECQFVFHSETSPIEVLSLVCQARPSVLVFDDDLLRPSSAEILRNIKKLHETVKIVFVTSDSSLDIGRSVSQIGIQYYAVKPIETDEFRDTINAIKVLKEKSKY